MRLSYQVGDGANVQTRELPFVIGVLGDFTGHPEEPLPRLKERKFIELNPDNFDSVLDGMKARLAFSVEDRLSGGTGAGLLKVDLRFRWMDDFEPTQVARQIRPLRDLLDLQRHIRDLANDLARDARLDAIFQQCVTSSMTMQEVSAIEENQDSPFEIPQILLECGWTADPWAEWTGRGTAANLVFVLRHIAASGPMAYSRDSGAMLEELASGLERVIRNQLDVVLNHPEFLKLEATWRSLSDLCSRCQGLAVKVKVLNVTKRDLLRDLQRAPEYDQSAFYRHGYAEFGVLGGEPFGLWVGAYSFGYTPEDVEMLERVSQVSATLHCPFLAAAEPSLLQLETFNEIEIPRSFRKVFETTGYAKWRSFRQSDDSRYVGLVLPRMRIPRQRAEEILWGNAAFALAANVAHGVSRDGLAEVTVGEESGGLVHALVEVEITDERQVELSELGLIALCKRKNSTDAVFFDLPSCHQPRIVAGQDALNAQQRLSAQLENVITASRFAHYLKCILRDKFGSFSRAGDWQRYLETWIRQYVLPETGLADGDFALSSASIEIHPIGNHVVATMSPRFRNRASAAVLRLVVSLPQMREVKQ